MTQNAYEYLRLISTRAEEVDERPVLATAACHLAAKNS